MISKTLIAMTMTLCSFATLCLAEGEIQTKTEDKTTMTGKAANPKVIFETSQGNFTVELFPDKAPISVANFLQYAKDGHYTNTIFHRIIPGFVVQGGGMTVDLKQKPTRAGIKLESQNGLSNSRGTLSMARTMDPNSATSQFYINLSDNTALDYTSPTPRGYGYAVFGKVVEGMDVIDKMAKVKTVNSGGHSDVPLDPIEVENVTVKE